MPKVPEPISLTTEYLPTFLSTPFFSYITEVLSIDKLSKSGLNLTTYGIKELSSFVNFLVGVLGDVRPEIFC